MWNDIEVHVRRLRLSGGALAVVAAGTEVYGATGPKPVAALTAVAAKASAALASRGHCVEASAIVALGRRVLGLEAGTVHTQGNGGSGPPASEP
jgi:antitoxin (DNA-binding transcriptional repressor) of toxin-antitoxin stability system